MSVDKNIKLERWNVGCPREQRWLPVISPVCLCPLYRSEIWYSSEIYQEGDKFKTSEIRRHHHHFLKTSQDTEWFNFTTDTAQTAKHQYLPTIQVKIYKSNILPDKSIKVYSQLTHIQTIDYRKQICIYMVSCSPVLPVMQWEDRIHESWAISFFNISSQEYYTTKGSNRHGCA